jgi:hypothetical protein
MEAAAGFEPAHNGFAVRSLNHLGTPPWTFGTHSYTTRAATATDDLSALDTLRASPVAAAVGTSRSTAPLRTRGI